MAPSQCRINITNSVLDITYMLSSSSYDVSLEKQSVILVPFFLNFSGSHEKTYFSKGTIKHAADSDNTDTDLEPACNVSSPLTLTLSNFNYLT